MYLLKCICYNYQKIPIVNMMLKPRSLIVLVLLFLLSIPIPSVVAQLPLTHTMAQREAGNLELVNQAKSLYQAGLFNQAAEVWQEVIARFSASGDSLNQGMAWSNLSLTYQQLGQWQDAQDAINRSLDLLGGVTTPDGLRILAQSLDIQGNLQRAIGQPEQSIETWQKAEQFYRDLEAKDNITQNLINQAESLQDLGLYPKACETLLKALEFDHQNCEISAEQLETLGDKSQENRQRQAWQSRGLSALGNVLRVMGQRENSQMVLGRSLQLAEELNDSQSLAIAYLSLANTTRVLGDDKTALTYYDQAINLAISPRQQIFAQLDKLTLLQAMKNWSAAQELSSSIASSINSLPASHGGIYAQIKLARSLMTLSQQDNSLLANSPIFSKINQKLLEAAEQAKLLGDDRALAYAIGDRGNLYELTEQYDLAQDLTLAALAIASNYQYPEIAYQFYWQLGRIQKAQGEIKEAITSYNQAVNTLKSLRADLVAIGSDVQFSFRESVEPIYRELVSLVSLLLSNQPETAGESSQSNLILARNTIESLQLAELDNFFQDACVTQKPVKLDEVDPNAAILYTIILPDRLEIIAALPGQPLRHYPSQVSQAEIEETIQAMRNALTSILDRRAYRTRLLPVAEKLYNWLIAPLEADLRNQEVKTLVFVLDGMLRNIPMAALYDGEKYLMEKYSVALTPGLQLFDPKPLPRENISTLTAGLSKARQGFSELPYVELEIQQIQSTVPTLVLLNESFTQDNLQSQVKSKFFPVVHIATHGEFSSNEEDTFILTWDRRINPKQLDSLLKGNSQDKNAIELLVLSACQTAVGDRRAALGLAGVAVRAGVRSTLASLWYVNDEATTQLMTQFYREFVNQNISKAEALRRSQQKILQDEKFFHPYFWSGFVLVGNWL